MAIDLATTADFALGPVLVRPAFREMTHRGGHREVLEPRMMQVFVALAEADGIVSRSRLTELCWDGRVVGEDSINRVISRLRRLWAGIGAGVFEIETIAKVGYRLVVCTAAEAAADTAAAAIPLPAVVDAPAIERERRERIADQVGEGDAGAVNVARMYGASFSTKALWK